MWHFRIVVVFFFLHFLFYFILRCAELRRYESAVRVVFGSIKLSRPPPASKTATMNVGAGQYKSSNCAITMFPIMPPRRALIIDMATPVALQQEQQKKKHRF